MSTVIPTITMKWPAYCPWWIQPASMRELGYECTGIDSDLSYLTFKNAEGADSYTSIRWKSSTHTPKMPEGKREIYIRTNFNVKEEELFVKIIDTNDLITGKPATLYCGVVRTREELIFVLNSVR